MKKKDKIPTKLKELVKKSIRNHCWNIGVSHYAGDILYMEQDKEKEDGCFVLATATVDRRYLKCTFKIYPAAIKEWEESGDKVMDEIIAHEVSHIATQHMMDLVTACYKDEGEAKDAWESLTQVIANLSIKIQELENKKK